MIQCSFHPRLSNSSSGWSSTLKFSRLFSISCRFSMLSSPTSSFWLRWNGEENVDGVTETSGTARSSAIRDDLTLDSTGSALGEEIGFGNLRKSRRLKWFLLNNITKNCLKCGPSGFLLSILWRIGLMEVSTGLSKTAARMNNAIHDAGTLCK